MNVKPWEKLHATVRNGILALVNDPRVIIDKPTADLTLTIVTTPNGIFRIELKGDGLLHCSSCTWDKTEEDPCKHIGAALNARKLYGPSAPSAAAGNMGNQLPRHLKAEFDAVRTPWMFDMLAMLLAAIPVEVTATYRHAGRGRPVPIGVLAYACIVWCYLRVTRKVALQQLCNEMHRDILRRHFKFEWPAEEYSAKLGKMVAALPFREERLYWFLSHPATAYYLDFAMALCGVVMREFEDVSGWDGTGEQLFIFCMYAEDRVRLLRRNDRFRRLAAKQRRSGSAHADDETLQKAVEDPISLTEEEVRKIFGPEIAEEDEKTMRRRLYIKVIVGSCHRSGIIAAVFMAKPGGEQRYGVPMAVRMLETVATPITVKDRGYVKDALSLLAQRTGIESYTPAMVTEKATGSGPAKKARKKELEKQRGNPEYVARMQALRVKQESLNHTKDRIIGTSIRSRGPCIRAPADKKPMTRKEQKEWTEAHRRKLTDVDMVRMENETRVQWLGLNGYHFAKWKVILTADNERLRQAGLDEKKFILWDTDLNPNFRAAAQIYPPRLFRSAEAMMAQFGLPPDECEAAVEKAYPRGWKLPERFPNVPAPTKTTT